MLPRIVEIADSPARLRVRHKQLVIDRDGQTIAVVPLDELAVLVVAHPQVTYSQAVLADLLAAGGVFIACDARRQPAGMMAPLCNHHLMSERLLAQARAPLPLQKRIWRQIVRAKVRAQARTLVRLRGHDGGLTVLIPQVRSGDPTNIEARAARRYWSALFPHGQFRRDWERPDENQLFNYGYAVLRAIVARGICAAGLHPGIGVHHHNRYNPFCLADDLMEPFRPLVDWAVAQRLQPDEDYDEGLTSEMRRYLIESLLRRFVVGGESRTLFDLATRIAASLAAVFQDTNKVLELPEDIAIDAVR